MKVLTIGNSFSEDATRYLSQIASADGECFEVVNVCIGGCPFEWHYNNMIEDKKAYMLIFNGEDTGFFVTLKDALTSREWDVISLQQVSHLSFKKETYYPYVTELVKYIRSLQPKAKLLLHETWAYEDGSERLFHIAGYDTRKAMLGDIKKAYESVAEDEDFDGIIPSGELFDAMLDNGVERVHRDTFHASWGLGRYALGLLWFRMLTGKSVAENSFAALDAPASADDIAIAKSCVDSFAPIFSRRNNMSNKTLYVSDLDGTLLRSNQTLSEYTVSILNRLVSEGVTVTYATARSYATSSIVAAGFDAKVPVIVYNGTFILENGTKRRLLSHFFSRDEAELVTDTLVEGGIYPIVYSYVEDKEKYFYCPSLISDPTENFLKTRRGDGRDNEVESVDKLCNGDVFHFSCVDTEEKLLPLYEKLKERFSCVYYKEMYSGDWWLEVHPTGVSKANALLELKKLLECDRIVCFGDGRNDISMFKIADECYAVANAEPELKEIATDIIGGNNDDGVAKWLSNLIK